MAYTPLKSVKEGLEALLDAVQSIRVLGAVRGVLADLRVSVVALPASISTSSTITNQQLQGTYHTNNLVQSQTNTNAVLSNINNIKITP